MPTTTVEYNRETEVNSHGEGKVIQLNPKFDKQDSLNSTEPIPFFSKTSNAPKLSTSDNYSDEEFDYLPILKISKSKEQTSKLALNVIRTHYSKELIKNLEWLAENHESNNPLSIPYISSLLSFTKEYFDEFFHDPFSSFLLAMYDGLTHNGAYLAFEKSVYQKCLDYIKALNDQELDYKIIDKYIFKLEEIGMNITPY